MEPELKEELEHSSLWNRYFNSLCDYLFIFILKSIEQLVDEGELIFICTEYWMNTTHSVTLRNYMTQHGYFSEIFHFKEAPLFEDVCASFIIFRFVKSRRRSKTINLYRYTKDNAPSFEELSSFSCFTKEVIPQFEIDKRWLLATKEQQDRLDSFESKCEKEAANLFSNRELNRIGDICDIGNGMVSGLDKAFNISSVNSLNQKEQSCVIKVLKAKDLGFFRAASESQYFFIRERITEEEFSSQMPHVGESCNTFGIKPTPFCARNRVLSHLGHKSSPFYARNKKTRLQGVRANHLCAGKDIRKTFADFCG